VALRKDLRAAGAAFVVMEPVAYLGHRFVMHGIGWALHRSHHRLRKAGRWLEANDAFPAAFAALTVSAMAIGTSKRRLRILVPVGAGVTAYGAAYFFVHDVSAHGRLGGPAPGGPVAELARRHWLHHRFGGEPYGMLAPVLPSELKARAVAEGLIGKGAADRPIGPRRVSSVAEGRDRQEDPSAPAAVLR
jgi:beta-carotene 3-hydroxylase